MKLPKLMGILNLTPDSFSDGGKFNTPEKALKRVKEMEKFGADILDIGGESTGPNSKKVSEKIEYQRIIPILKTIKNEIKIPISVDTYKAEIAEAAIKNGASIINDITGLRGDNNMALTIAKNKVKVIIMYSKDSGPRTTIKRKEYKNVVQTVMNFFEERIKFAVSKGIKRKNIILDPGFGHYISSIPIYSYELIAGLKSFKKFNMPITLGISRKSALGGNPDTRDSRGLPLNAIAYILGADILRVHNVKETNDFLKNLY